MTARMHRLSSLRRRPGRRRGISLMELIFSLGVIIVGLLGVAVLVPAAGRVAQMGSTLDQAARSGHNWVRDFEARGYMQPGAWVIADATNSAAYANDVNAMGVVTTYAYEKSFCIDPRYAATHGDSYFPYPATATDARMRRISVRAAAGSARLTQDQSDELFMAHDDLVFDRPVDPLFIPIQVYGAAGGKRQSEDRLSYLVTVVPKLQGYNLYRDSYTVSIVVFKNRDPLFDTGSKAPEHDNERFVEVASFHGAAGGGGDVQVGDVQLRARSGRTAAEAFADLEVHRGNWLMLSGVTPVFAGYNPMTGAVQTIGLPVFRWYRVVHANEPELNAANEWVVDVTLHGPDWNSNVIDGNGNVITKATVMTDVVAVYEKTIRAETSSLWMR